MAAEIKTSLSKATYNCSVVFEGVSGIVDFASSPLFYTENHTWEVQYSHLAHQLNLYMIDGPVCRISTSVDVVCDNVTIRSISQNVSLLTDANPCKQLYVGRTVPGVQHRVQFNIELNLHKEGQLSVPTTTILRRRQTNTAPERQNQTVAADVARLLDQEATTDITIQMMCGNQVKAHKLVLAMRSEVFRTMLSGTMREAITYHINITDFPSDVVRRFVRYLYLDVVPEIDLQRHAGDLHAIARKYLVGGLEVVCRDYMLQTLSPASVLEVLQLAEFLSSQPLRTGVLKYIFENHVVLAANEAFMQQLDQYMGNSYGAGATGQTAQADSSDDSQASPVQGRMSGTLRNVLTALAGVRPA